MRALLTSSALRWNVLGVVVVVALVVALWPRDDAAAPASAAPSRASSTAAPADGDTDLAPARAAAALAACPTGAPGAGTAAGPLAGVTLDCLADGRPLDLGAALAGKPAVLDVWAWWCGPCREELPAMAEYAARAGDAVTVLTVHADPQTGGGLARLADYGVRLPGVADPSGRVAALTGAPQVLPTTILVRADGTVAATLAEPFTSADDIAAAVADGLGVRV